eukprot:5675657-Amphidinium_carterae.1
MFHVDHDQNRLSFRKKPRDMNSKALGQFYVNELLLVELLNEEVLALMAAELSTSHYNHRAIWEPAPWPELSKSLSGTPSRQEEAGSPLRSESCRGPRSIADDYV